MKILFINACVRKESRTLVLAKEVMKNMEGDVTEINLDREKLLPLDAKSLAMRDKLLRDGAFNDPMLKYARQFADADEIVIAAPFWDLSFPAALKVYLEQITASGITFEYIDGRPRGLCRAKKLTYVTTSGGKIFCDFGYNYVKALANLFYGIKDTVSVRAENLDVEEITCDRLLSDAVISTIK